MTKAFAVDILLTVNIETCRCGRFFVVSNAGWQGQTHIYDLLLPIHIISIPVNLQKEWIECRIEKNDTMNKKHSL